MGENDIQDACKGALQAYCNGKVRYVQLSPYANQQSANIKGKSNLFAADVIGVLGDSAMLLLEMKYYDLRSKLLPKFEQDQFDDLLELEHAGVPVAYCYNSTDDLEYFGDQRDPKWPQATLAQFMRSRPSTLPNNRPDIEHHSTLLQWMRATESGSSGNDMFAAFTKVLNRSLRPGEIRNQILLLIYSDKMKSFIGMDAKDMENFAHWILEHPSASAPSVAMQAQRIRDGLSPRMKQRIRTLLDPQGNPLDSVPDDSDSTHYAPKMR